MAEEDLLFGKNRHLFGGIEPSTMRRFEVVRANGSVTINADLPLDTKIGGHTVCVVAGAVIRRGGINHPTNEFDGDEVMTITSSGSFVDTTADIDGVYTYSAFPFSTLGVYSRNKKNRATYNEPENMVEFKGKSRYSTSEDTIYIDITYKLPPNVAGAIIRRSTVSYPLDENDGEFVADVAIDGMYSDKGLTDKVTYYYSAFPYNINGYYNRNPKNRFSVRAVKYTYFYGYDINLNDPNPKTRVTYPSDVDNYGFTPAGIKKINEYTFDNGSWDLNAGHDFIPRPCLLNPSGVVEKYLNPKDYTKTIDGADSNVYLKKAVNPLDAMVEFNIIYTKRWESDGVYHFRCCDIKLDNDYECWCNYDDNNTIKKHFYISIFPVRWVAHSWGNGVTSAYSHGAEVNGESFMGINRSLVTNKGTGWDDLALCEWMLLTDLSVMISKSTNTQESLGDGGSGTSTPTIKNMFIGAHNYSYDASGGNVTFGILCLYAYPTFILGFNNDEQHNMYIKFSHGTKDGTLNSKFIVNDSYDVDSNSTNKLKQSYLKLPWIVSNNLTTYIKDQSVFNNFGLFPKTGQGSLSTYTCDRMYFTTPKNAGIYTILVGGQADRNTSDDPYVVFPEDNGMYAISNRKNFLYEWHRLSYR